MFPLNIQKNNSKNKNKEKKKRLHEETLVGPTLDQFSYSNHLPNLLCK